MKKTISLFAFVTLITTFQYAQITPQQAGTLHNEILSYADSRMNPADPNSLEVVKAEAIRVLQTFTSPTVPSFTIGSEVSQVINQTCDGYSSGVTVFITNYINRSRNYLADASANNKLHPEEVELFNQLLDAISNNLTNEENMMNAIENVKSALESANLNEANHEGYLTAITISVAENSSLFWANYGSGGGGGHRIKTNKILSMLVPAWVAADAVGAAIGGLSSIWSDYSNGNDINWGNAGGQAVLWGAGASIPSTRWFKKLVP